MKMFLVNEVTNNIFQLKLCSIYSNHVDFKLFLSDKFICEICKNKFVNYFSFMNILGHGSGQNNPWMKLMGIVHKERRHGHDNTTSQSGSNERTLNM